MKKKILYVVESFGGGVFSYLVDLTSALVDDYEICIAYSRRPQTPENFEKYFSTKVHFINVRYFQRSINAYKDLRALLELRQICRQYKPDIIHLNSSKAGIIGRLAFLRGKIPMFYTPHGYSFLMQDASPLKRKLYWTFEKIMSYANCTTISCGKSEDDATRTLTKRALLIPNGVNVTSLDSVRSSNSNVRNEHLVVTVGRISEQKNPVLFNQIAESLPEYNFVWIGDGELRNTLSAKNVRVTGWLSRQETLHEVEQATYFILCSLWEGLPISLLEAMYLRKTCLVSNVAGNVDVIENSVNGFVCNSVTDYVDEIQQTHSDEKLNQRINTAAYNTVKDQYTMEIASEAYRQQYNKALAHEKIR